MNTTKTNTKTNVKRNNKRANKRNMKYNMKHNMKHNMGHNMKYNMENNMKNNTKCDLKKHNYKELIQNIEHPNIIIEIDNDVNDESDYLDELSDINVPSETCYHFDDSSYSENNECPCCVKESTGELINYNDQLLKCNKCFYTDILPKYDECTHCTNYLNNHDLPQHSTYHIDEASLDHYKNYQDKMFKIKLIQSIGIGMGIGLISGYIAYKHI